jgi:hypothetical protein
MKQQYYILETELAKIKVGNKTAFEYYPTASVV